MQPGGAAIQKLTEPVGQFPQRHRSGCLVRTLPPVRQYLCDQTAGLFSVIVAAHSVRDVA